MYQDRVVYFWPAIITNLPSFVVLRSGLSVELLSGVLGLFLFTLLRTAAPLLTVLNKTSAPLAAAPAVGPPQPRRLRHPPVASNLSTRSIFQPSRAQASKRATSAKSESKPRNAFCGAATERSGTRNKSEYVRMQGCYALASLSAPLAVLIYAFRCEILCRYQSSCRFKNKL